MLQKIEPRFTDNNNNAFLLHAFHLDMSELPILYFKTTLLKLSPPAQGHHLSE